MTTTFKMPKFEQPVVGMASIGQASIWHRCALGAGIVGGIF
jgi:hypothetical protein